MTEVFVVCPARSESGGPELCHQLVHTLNTQNPGRASIVYQPFETRHDVPPPYRRYDVRPARKEDIPDGATVVLPETFGPCLEWFPGCRIVFWWMSVNNFHKAARADAARQLDLMRSLVGLHLYQSEYARGFLTSAHLGPTARLSDALAADYITAIDRPPTSVRKDLVAFNPAKGAQRTEQIFHAMLKSVRTAPKVIALQGMSRKDMMHVLSEAKVYIDFGEHPGKDRMPREAAALGACVITNKRGSAGNKIDVPIPEDCKIDDRKPGWECRAANKIRTVLDDYDQQARRFDEYRQMIAAGPAQFTEDVRSVFSEQLVA